MVRDRFYIFIAIVVHSVMSFSQSISIGISWKSNHAPVQDTINLLVGVQSTFEISTVTASINNLSSELSFNTNSGRFEGDIILTSFDEGMHTVEVTVLDVMGNSTTSSREFLYDTRPVLEIQSPVSSDVTSATLHLDITCTDKSDPDCRIEVLIDTPNELLKLEGISQIVKTVDVSNAEGSDLRLLYRAYDSHQVTTKEEIIYIESSPHLSLIHKTKYPIRDFDGDNILHSSYKITGAEIYNLTSSETTTIPFDEPVRQNNLFLTSRGCVFQNYCTTVCDKSIYEWVGDSVRDLNVNIITLFIASDDFVVWSESPLNTLYRYQLSTDQLVQIDTDSYWDDVSENGTVTYWKLITNQAYAYRDGEIVQLSSDSYINSRAVTDGELFVYRKHDSCCGEKFAIALHDGTSESILRGFEQRENRSDRYQIANGFVAYGKLGSTNQNQIWLRHPNGENHQITFFGSNSELELLNPLGEMSITIDDKRILADKFGNYSIISSDQGKPYWEDGKWFVAIEGSLFQVDIATEKHTLTDLSLDAATNSTLSFSSSEFSEAYMGPGELIKLSILELPKNGVLSVGTGPHGPNIVQEVPTELIRQRISRLEYIPNEGFIGEDSFTWNASNGLEYAENNSVVNINVTEVITGNQKLSGQVILYPNPVSDILHFSAPPNATIAIYNMAGRKIEEKLADSNLSDHTVDVGSLNSGLYYLKIESKNGISTERFIKR